MEMDESQVGRRIGLREVMEDADQAAQDAQGMHKRQVTLADGRYMIFYTFGGSAHEGGSPPTELIEAEENTDV